MGTLVSDNSFEMRPETHDQAINQLRHILEEFKDRPALNNFRLCERYVEGRINLIFAIRRADNDYVAHVQRSADVMQGVAGFVIGSDPAGRREDPSSSERNEGDNQSVVFVRDVKCMEPVKFVCTSTVWLGSVDQIYSIAGHALYFSNLAGFVTLGIREDRTSATWLKQAVSNFVLAVSGL